MAWPASACLLLLSSLLLMPWAVAQDAPSTFAMQAPRLGVGDFHEYAHSFPRNGSEVATLVERREVYGNGVMDVEGEPTRVLLVRSTTASPDERRVGTIDEMVLRADDLATVVYRADVEGEAVETRYDPPCAEHAPYPLVVGEQMEGVCAVPPGEGGPGLAYAWRAEVLRRETVEVPAGRFDAFVVRSSADGGALVWYAPQACGVVRMTNRSGSDAPFTVELQRFHCRDTETRSVPTPTPMTPGDFCGAVPGARCTPAVGAAGLVAGIGALALVAARPRR